MDLWWRAIEEIVPEVIEEEILVVPPLHPTIRPEQVMEIALDDDLKEEEEPSTNSNAQPDSK